MTEWKRMEQPELPPREELFLLLRAEECSEEDYALAEKVRESFDCKTMKDYTELYLKCMNIYKILKNFARFLVFFNYVLIYFGG